MKWEQDLIRDIRTHTQFDNFDWNDGRIARPDPWPPAIEVSDASRAALLEKFMLVRDNCPAILEIGIGRPHNKDQTHTNILLTHKHPDTVYIGIDIEDRAWLNDPAKNIHTLVANSVNVQENIERFKSLGVSEFGLIFIDGWHSINNVLTEWEYTNMLVPHGIVGFHDVTEHPGPHYFVRALNTEKWNVEIHNPWDYGIGFAWRK